MAQKLRRPEMAQSWRKTVNNPLDKRPATVYGHPGCAEGNKSKRIRGRMKLGDHCRCEAWNAWCPHQDSHGKQSCRAQVRWGKCGCTGGVGLPLWALPGADLERPRSAGTNTLLHMAWAIRAVSTEEKKDWTPTSLDSQPNKSQHAQVSSNLGCGEGCAVWGSQPHCCCLRKELKKAHSKSCPLQTLSTGLSNERESMVSRSLANKPSEPGRNTFLFQCLSQCPLLTKHCASCQRKNLRDPDLL